MKIVQWTVSNAETDAKTNVSSGNVSNTTHRLGQYNLDSSETDTGIVTLRCIIDQGSKRTLLQRNSAVDR